MGYVPEGSHQVSGEGRAGGGEWDEEGVKQRGRSSNNGGGRGGGGGGGRMIKRRERVGVCDEQLV